MQGDVLTVEFTVIGIPCLGLNGGPAFKHDEAFSFQVAIDIAHCLPRSRCGGYSHDQPVAFSCKRRGA
jgi:hypothetical protein